MRQAFRHALRGIAATWVTAAGITGLAQGVPEPGIVLYGKVWEDSALVTAGDLTWTYTSLDGTVTVQVSTALRAIDAGMGDTYSYCVDLPAESTTLALASSANVLPATEAPVTYGRAAIIDGVPVAIAGGATTDAFCLDERGKTERLDLAKAGVVPTSCLSGTVSYAGRQPGITIVQVFDNAGFSGAPNATMTVPDTASPDFAATDLLSGAYYVRGFRDHDADGTPGGLEAYGECPDNPLVLPPDSTDLVVPLMDVDSDDDGLPDWWEWEQFGTLAHGAGSDFDGDGEDNGAEYADHTHAADARCTHDPANAYDDFEFRIWREAGQAVVKAFAEDCWGVDLVCAAPEGLTVVSGTLTKPDCTAGENPVDLEIDVENGTAFWVCAEYASFEGLTADAVSGAYGVHVVLEDETKVLRDLRFVIDVPAYDAASFPDYVAVEAPLPGSTDVSTGPLVVLGTRDWDALWLREQSGDWDVYRCMQTPGDFKSHQVPLDTLTEDTAYSLRVRAVDSVDSCFTSITRSEFVTAPPVIFHTVTFMAEPNGTLTGDVSQTLDPGESATPVTAHPDPGYGFAGWMIDGTDYGSQNPLQITDVTEDMALIAVFSVMPHDADQNVDWTIQISPELTRLVQFINSGHYHCQEGTEDGFAPGEGMTGGPCHDADQNKDWTIQLSPELTRLVQFVNSGGYHSQPGTEDGYAPGLSGRKAAAKPGTMTVDWTVRAVEGEEERTIAVDLLMHHTSPAEVRSLAMLGEVPLGWTYAGVTEGPRPDVVSSSGNTGNLGFAWIGMPASWPMRLTILLKASDENARAGRLNGRVRYREASGEQSVALPHLVIR